MANVVQQLGDNTSHEVRPDFESARAYYWMKHAYEEKINGKQSHLPHKPRRGQAEHAFFAQVDQRLTRKSFVGGVSFDENGRIIR